MFCSIFGDGRGLHDGKLALMASSLTVGDLKLGGQKRFSFGWPEFS